MKTKILKDIYTNSIIDELYAKIYKFLPIERSVIFEKYKRPICIFPERENTGDEDADWAFLNHYAKYEMLWYDNSDMLHSYFNNPSRISWDSRDITIEWHKNGVPLRKNCVYNRIIIRNDYSYDLDDRKYTEGKVNVIYQSLNKRGELHSYNDMPAIIDRSLVSWYWNGNCLRKQYTFDELPCEITVVGHMKFKTNINDSFTSLNFPLSSKHYGKSELPNLKNYEKYVQWPIRQLLTL